MRRLLSVGAFEYDLKQLLGLPHLPPWMQPDVSASEHWATWWADVRSYAASPQLDLDANELRRHVWAWANEQVECGSDLNLLPRLGYPSVDIMWLREQIEAAYVSYPRLLLLIEAGSGPEPLGPVTHNLDDSKKATGPQQLTSPMGRCDVGANMASGVVYVFQDMQRTLRWPELPTEFVTCGCLPTYLYHLWPHLRAICRDPDTQKTAANWGNRPEPSPLAVFVLLLAVIAVRLGITATDYFRLMGLTGCEADQTEHKVIESALGRDTTPCHT